MSIDNFIRGYIGCALWSETDNADDSGGEPLDENYDEDDLAPEARQAMEDDCRSFYRDNEETWGTAWDDSQAGYDFWLTRNGHGAGFWDRYAGGTDEGKAGDVLTKAAKVYGESHLYIGDDGMIYVG